MQRWQKRLELTGLTLVLTLALAALAKADDEAARNNWAQWRGPFFNGVSSTADPPVNWDEATNIKWKTEIPGRGSSSPVVWNDRIFLMTSVVGGDAGSTDAGSADAVANTRRAPSNTNAGEPPRGQAAGRRQSPRPQDPRAQGQPRAPGQDRAPGQGQGQGRRRGFGGGPAPTTPVKFMVLCLDRATGKVIWNRTVNERIPHEGLHSTNTFASGSPVTDGKYVYASFSSYGVYCLDMDGHVVWDRDLGDMQTRNGFGEGATPALHENTLVVPWDHEGASFIEALDAKTGKTLWKVDRDEKTTWATPLIVEHDGRQQVITNGTTRVRSYDLKTGELIWECGGQATNPIPSPILVDDMVVCMTGYRGYAIYAIPLDARGDITDSEMIAWAYTKSAPYVSSAVLYGDQLYFTKSRDAVLSSLDARTGGEIISQQRLPEARSFYASPVAAADRIYFTSREGVTVVLKHGSELDVLATNRLGEGIDASPALVGNQMFIRGEKHLYCIQQP